MEYFGAIRSRPDRAVIRTNELSGSSQLILAIPRAFRAGPALHQIGLMWRPVWTTTARHARTMDRFELAPVDRNARFRQQAYLSAKRDKLDANLTDRRPVIFAEIGNRFVIGDKLAGEPHDLNVAPATLDGVDTVRVALNLMAARA
jgi:hypothetical protein